MNKRREFLKQVSLFTGGMGIWQQMPASIQKALSIEPLSGSTFHDAEHVVLLMQENRSFDHCYGALQGVRGFNDPRAIDLPGGQPVWMQGNKEGQRFAPFRLNIKDTKATWMSSLPHSWTDQLDARNNGFMDGWLEAKRPGSKQYAHIPMTMGYYNREDIPFYYALADAFTVCDQHFCASLTGTTANRSFFWSGKIREHADTIARVRNSDLYYNREASWKTFPERLEENGISWKVYQNEISLQSGLNDEDDAWLSNFTDNNLEWFSQYNVRFSKTHYAFLQKRVVELPSEISALELEIKQAQQNQRQQLAKKLTQKKEQLSRFREEIIKWDPAKFAGLSASEKSLHQRAFTTNIEDPHYRETEQFSYDDNGEQRSTRLPKGDILHQFRKDVDSGQLPAVSWLVAPQNFSDHPSSPWYGAWYVSEVMDILTKNPEVWKKTIFILTYDENDGYFDHIPPFVAPKPNDPTGGKVSKGINTAVEYVTMEEELGRKDMDPKDAREGPVGLGFRVPLVIASPWTRGGWVNSEVCDITSVLMFLEEFLSRKTGKDIRESNISDWRRTVSGNLVSAFRPFEGEKIQLPLVGKHEFVKAIHRAQFKGLPSNYTDQQLPRQETGIRDSCALPYELYADSALAAGKRSVGIRFHIGSEVFGDLSAGAPFNVYAGNMNASPRAYAVRAGDNLQDQWNLKDFENGNYQLRVYGPNGFFRAFGGNANDPAIGMLLLYEREKGRPNALTGNIVVSLKHAGKSGRFEIEIIDNSYKNASTLIVLDKPGASVTQVIDCSKSFNWYDISLKVKGNNIFEKRYAGRVETGRHGKTDPLMGGMMFE